MRFFNSEAANGKPTASLTNWRDSNIYPSAIDLTALTLQLLKELTAPTCLARTITLLDFHLVDNGAINNGAALKLSHVSNCVCFVICRGTNQYIGNQTSAAACVGCLCFCLPGLLVLLCPCDERDAYKVNGNVYDASGALIGPAQGTSFVPKHVPMQR
jgi:hypothetical protein